MILKKKYDGFIIATHPSKQTKILIEILKLTAPVIVEKPLCLKNYEFRKILKHTKLNQIIYANHYHLFSKSFKIFEDSFDVSNIRNILIQDGNLGPFRKNVPPIFDWSPHSFGIIFKLFKNKAFNVYFSKKLIMKKDKIEASIWKFLFTFDTGQKVIVKVGNGFNRRINKVSIILNNNKSIKYENETNLKENEPLPMEILLRDFHKSILYNNQYKKISFDITKRVTNFLFNTLKITK